MVLPRFSTKSAPRPVSTPSDSHAISASPVAFQEAVERAKRVDAIDRIGFWRDLAQRDPRGAGRHQRDVARGLGERNQSNAAAVVVGVGDQLVSGLDPRVPACGRAPAVVEQDHQRRVAAADPGLRIPDRPCGGKDDQRGGGKPQQGQPPRRPRRGFFPRPDVEQQPRRRKLDPSRPRRHDAQQPPQHRQAQQAQQQQRLRKGEGKPRYHALRPALTVEPRALPLAAIMPECRNSSSSAAERLVVWVENSQLSRLVSLRISSRCSATRAT